VATVTLSNGDVLEYTFSVGTQSPVDAYSAWAADLGVSDSATLHAIDGDDEAWPITLASQFLPGGSTTAFFSSEAGIGLYRSNPSNTTKTAYTLMGVSRFYGLISRPNVVLTYHTSGDLKSVSSKVQRSGATTIIFSKHTAYSSESLLRYDAAIKIENGAITFVGSAVDQDTPIYWHELVEEDATTIIQQELVTTQTAGTIVNMTAVFNSDVVARVSAPPAMGSIAARAAIPVMALAYAPPAIGGVFAISSVVYNAYAAAPSALGGASALAAHDFTGQLGDVITRYVMDLVTPTGTVRIPISSWQSTLQTGSSNYVQCVIPAAAPWSDAINTATEFVIYRRAVLPSGLSIEYEMARAPAQTTQFDRGPSRHTCTLSGYSPAFAASENPDSSYDRTLAGIRSISSGGSYRVRCAIDWLLRPGQRAIVEGAPFVVSYINYYAMPADSYMDVGD
jgi:hypothetical protein